MLKDVSDNLFIKSIKPLIPPDLSEDGLSPGLVDWIIKASEAIDEMVPPIQPQLHLGSTALIPDPRWLLQHPSPLHGIRA